MQLKQHVTGSRAIVYDADRIQQPDPGLFAPEYWKSANCIVGQAQGRGNALLLQTPYGPAVLRQYLRGGFAARLSRDQYLYLGLYRSRPFAEANLLARLWSLGLPVPEVLGALCTRHGMTYSGALLTLRIPDAITMADMVSDSFLPATTWISIGKCIRRFHDAGVYHADLNIRNILVDAAKKVWLLDFDRAKMVPQGSPTLASNLQRLKRSLRKDKQLSESQLEQFWDQLMAGYNDASRQGDTPGVEEKGQ
jgi:3-deoxy-D-manno-octulosonic acid kinase